MKPTLFDFFGYPVASYAAFMAGGYLLAWIVLYFTTTKASKETRWQAFDLYVIAVISSLFGSKIAHTLFEASGHLTEDGRPIHSLFELLKEDPWHWARLGEPGFVWYGGMIATLLATFVYFKRRPKLDPWFYMDLFAVPAMFGAFVGRLGCFLAGCCHGRPTESVFGVQFPSLAVPVHPTQLYDSASALLIGFFLLWNSKRKKFEGESVAWMLMLYASVRFCTEFFRGDAERGDFWVFSTSQWLSFPIFLCGLGIYIVRCKQQCPKV